MKFSEAKKRILGELKSKEFLKRIAEEDETMTKFIPAIIKMNECNYLTINSQSGCTIRGNKSVHTGKPYKIIQRSYVEGFMKKSDAETFIQRIQTKTDKNAIIIYPVSESLFSSSSTSSVFDIPLTMTISMEKTNIDTHMSTIIPQEVYDQYLKHAHLSKSENVCYVFCWDSKWNRHANLQGGLFKDILEGLGTDKL